MTQGPVRSYEQMQQTEPAAWSIPGWEWSPDAYRRGIEATRPQIDRLARTARLAVGRLGAQLRPYLDDGLVLGRALMALIEMGHAAVTSSPAAEAHALGVVVEGLRTWIRGGAWFEVAWSRRVKPLCRAATRYGINCPELLADQFGLDQSQLDTAFVEAGLVFGVCPERMLPPGRPRAQQHELLTMVVGELPEQQRTVLTLYFREGLGFGEIAELLDLTGRDLQALYGRAAVHIRSSMYDNGTGA